MRETAGCRVRLTQGHIAVARLRSVWQIDQNRLAGAVYDRDTQGVLLATFGQKTVKRSAAWLTQHGV